MAAGTSGSGRLHRGADRLHRVLPGRLGGDHHDRRPPKRRQGFAKGPLRQHPHHGWPSIGADQHPVGHPRGLPVLEGVVHDHAVAPARLRELATGTPITAGQHRNRRGQLLVYPPLVITVAPQQDGRMCPGGLQPAHRPGRHRGLAGSPNGQVADREGGDIRGLPRPRRRGGSLAAMARYPKVAPGRRREHGTAESSPHAIAIPHPLHPRRQVDGAWHVSAAPRPVAAPGPSPRACAHQTRRSAPPARAPVPLPP